MHGPTRICWANLTSFSLQTMLRHGANSAHFGVGGSTHEVSPAAFGVVASWVDNLLRTEAVARAVED